VVGGNFIHDREDSTDDVTPANNFIRSVDNWSLFAQDTMKWNMFTLIPSGRFDHHGQFGQTSNPRVQLLADTTPWLRFSGSAARSFRAPTIDELYYPFTDFGTFNGTDFTFQGNPNLKPEKAWTYDAGFEVHVQEYAFKATYFRANVTNLIQAVNNFIPGTPDQLMSTSVNVGKARRQGAEVQISRPGNMVLYSLLSQIPFSSVAAVSTQWLKTHTKESLNYSYLENKGVPVGFTDYVDLAYSARHTLNYFATITPFKNWAWDHTVRYEDPRFSGNNQTGSKLGSMITWDMRLAYKWNQLDSYIQVKDLTDRRYETQAGYPLPGRTFIGGVTWHYE